MAKAKLQRESVVFYRSFFEAIKELEPLQQAEVYNAIFEYGLNGIEPKISGVAKLAFTLIRPQLEANNVRYTNGCKGAEYGQRGGRPRKTAEEETTQNNPVGVSENAKTETPKKPQNNPTGVVGKNPTQTPNVNEKDNVNDNDNVKDNENDNEKKKERQDLRAGACEGEGWCRPIPTLKEVVSFAEFRNSSVNPQSFYDTFATTTPPWTDPNGKHIVDWQRVFLAWEKRDNARNEMQPNKQIDFGDEI
ncbi:MAG: DUF6291 domain-containing protein [Corallococcus sp.]|nr:DUF6291 domain-containing protein [Corallococcus sp.]